MTNEIETNDDLNVTTNDVVTTKTKRVRVEKTITVADLARSNNIQPKIMRAKLRRHRDEIPATYFVSERSFYSKYASKIVAILTRDHRVKS